MSIAQQNEINELRARVEALEDALRQLSDSKALESRPVLTLPANRKNAKAN